MQQLERLFHGKRGSTPSSTASPQFRRRPFWLCGHKPAEIPATRSNRPATPSPHRPAARRRARQTRPAPPSACRQARPGAGWGTTGSDKACRTSLLIVDGRAEAEMRRDRKVFFIGNWVPQSHCEQLASVYPVTISLKSAMPEKPRSTSSIRPRFAPRIAASGSSTITLSKNASTTGRSVAMAASASP